MLDLKDVGLLTKRKTVKIKEKVEQKAAWDLKAGKVGIFGKPSNC